MARLCRLLQQAVREAERATPRINHPIEHSLVQEMLNLFHCSRVPIAAYFPFLAVKSSTMNWDQIKGKWKQAKGQAQQRWGDLTDDDLDKIDGKREELVGRVQERYGIAKDEAEKQVTEFESSCNCG